MQWPESLPEAMPVDMFMELADLTFRGLAAFEDYCESIDVYPLPRFSCQEIEFDSSETPEVITESGYKWTAPPGKHRMVYPDDKIISAKRKARHKRRPKSPASIPRAVILSEVDRLKEDYQSFLKLQRDHPNVINPSRVRKAKLAYLSAKLASRTLRH